MKLAVVAGEASGDLHASEVLRELRKLDPSLVSFGIGGDLLAGQGMRLLHHVREMAIVGLVNVVRHLAMFRRVMNELLEEIEKQRPDAVLLVDYPDFNLRVAKRARELGIRVIYYISPQVWAWRRGRVREIERNVDHMIVLFPFEEEFYRTHGVSVTYAGHPLIEEVGGVVRPPSTPGVTRIALLPGSRKGEVASLLPAMLGAVADLRKDRKVDAFIVQAPTIARHSLEEAVRASGVDVDIRPYDGGESVAAADLALSSSGTATLECAVIGTPVIVMYRLSRANYFLATRLVKLPYFSLVNIVAGRHVVPELLQHDVTPGRIAAEARRMLEPVAWERLRAELAEVRSRLGDAGASRRAAEAIMRTVSA